jgi:hypothetical protein
VRNLRDYLNTYGARSGGAAMYDAAETFFAAGGSELVVQRAFGPSAVNATIGLDSSKIVVTSRWPGAYYNAWTAAYTSASKTITIVKGSRTVTYTGTDAASLQAAASVDPDVTVTVSSLPASNVSATALASGADDFANVNWTTVLGKVTPAVGPGVIAAPGVGSTANAALATHAAANRRIALLTPGQTDTSATVITAQGNISASHKQYATYVYPWITVPDGSGGRKTIARFTEVNGVLESRSSRYEANVDLRFNDSARKGELILGTKLGQLDTIIADIDFSYAAPVAAGEEVEGKLILVKRNGDRIRAALTCARYLKN